MLDGMVGYIGLLMASLVAGIVIGLLRGEISQKYKAYISKAMTALVFVLILLMGIKTGSNNAVISNLGVYGLQSALITMAAIAGSILFAVIFEKLMFKEGVK